MEGNRGKSRTFDAAQEGQQLERTNTVKIGGKRHGVNLADLKSGSRFDSALRETEQYEITDSLGHA